MAAESTDRRPLLEAFLGDGRFPLSLTGMALLATGVFAILQSISGGLLPHDVHALGMDAEALKKAAGPNLVRFMFHDRVAFGGTLIAIGIAYWWLAEFPLRAAASWAWWTFFISGVCGFASFLAYLGYGYLDTWHGVATLLLLPLYLGGLWRSRLHLANPLRLSSLGRVRRAQSSPERLGRILLLFCGTGLIAAGLTILAVGMTFVFVPQDITFIGIVPDGLHRISPILVPLLAHDRAGFGGGLFSVGLLVTMMMLYSPLSRSLVEVVFLMGIAGFGAALGVHFAIGYTDFIHLSPAYAGCVIFLAGSALLAKALTAGEAREGSEELLHNAATRDAANDWLK